MIGWNKVKLSDCCEIISGATPRRDSPEFWGGDIAWVTPKDLSKLNSTYLNDTPEKITPKGLSSCSSKILPKGSILFSSRAPIGLIAIAGREMATNQGFKSLIPGEGVHNEYLYWCLKHITPSIVAQGRGATFKEVSKEIMSNVEIPLPPLEEQKRIAAILDKADAIRKRRKQSIELSEQFLRSAFLDMFGDPAFNPKGWNVVPLQDVLKEKSINGAYYPKESYSDNGVRMVHMSDAFYGQVTLDGIRRVSAPANDIEKYGLRSSDILVSRRSLNYEGAAKPCLIPSLSEPLIFESSLIRIRPDAKKISTIYLYHYLQNEAARSKYVFPLVTRSTISGINQSNLMRVKVVLPPIDLQHRFDAIVKSVDRKMHLLNDHLVRLDELFGSLQSRAFRDKL